jgi:uncharacterized membrane protein YoaK (UPF0700 family)
MKTSVRNELLVACLLTFAGGSMDACTFLGHGYVFATAQTGNLVLLAIDSAAGDWAGAARHVQPLVAFAAGVATSRVLEAKLETGAAGSPTVRLAVESVGLAALACIASDLPDMVVTGCVAFMAALQLTTFSRVGGWSFKSTITTGNLRDTFSALSAIWLDPSEPAHRRHAAVLGMICASFFTGALVGGFFVARIGDRTLWLTAAAVLLATVLSRRTAAAPATVPKW